MKEIRVKQAITSNKLKKKAIIMPALAILVILVLIGYLAVIKNVVKKWEDKIYPGVNIQGIDIGGMTKEEAKDKITEMFDTEIQNKKLHIKIEDKQYEISYSDIGIKYDIDEIVNEAYNMDKEKGIIQKYINIIDKDSKEKEILIPLSYDENKLKDYENKLKAENNKEPKNASINIKSNNNIEIIPEEEGKVLDTDELDAKIKSNITADINSNYEIQMNLQVTKSKITKDDLSKIKGVIGSFSTNYGSSPEGRRNNIEIATKAINGTIVMPGETFSFNDIVGPRTTERGYKEAGTYVGNKVEPGIGGGICQVSTTLYRAVMKANLRSVERTNHSMAVGYAKPGLDATVADGYLDYKFKNTYDSPIYIQGSTYGGVVTYNVFGDPSVLNGKTYNMDSEIIETIPAETKVVEDNTIPEGQEIQEGMAMTGYKTKSYQITYENGVEVNRELISADTYASVGVIVKKGTQKIDEANVNTETPSSEEASQNQGTNDGTSSQSGTDSKDAKNPQDGSNSETITNEDKS